MRYIIILSAFLVSGCDPTEFDAQSTSSGEITINVEVEDLPCIDGWLWTHIGLPVINYDTGEQVRCE
jgi:hypothetical protein